MWGYYFNYKKSKEKKCSANDDRLNIYKISTKIGLIVLRVKFFVQTFGDCVKCVIDIK